jgi:hypothetical protein
MMPTRAYECLYVYLLQTGDQKFMKLRIYRLASKDIHYQQNGSVNF